MPRKTKLTDPSERSARSGFGRRWWGLGAIAGLVTILDQVSKALVRAYIPPGDALTVVPGCFDLVHGHNPGIVFGLFRGVPGLFTVLGLAVLPLLLWGYVVLPVSRAERIAWALMMGGALGNQIDRFTQGYVTDFVDWYFGSYHWYTFNLADAGITLGVALFLFLNLFVRGPEASADASPASTAPDASDPA